MPEAATSVSDRDILSRLNGDYIRSVPNGDVRRFEEILASDFRCSNPDGSLLDRAGFLAQTARPVTISNLKAQDVEIRLFGDVAIIHRGRATCWPTAAPAPAATPTSGRARTGNGSASPPTSRASDRAYRLTLWRRDACRAHPNSVRRGRISRLNIVRLATVSS